MKKFFAILLICCSFGLYQSVFACSPWAETDPNYISDSETCYPTVEATAAACAANKWYDNCSCATYTDHHLNTEGLPNGSYVCFTHGPPASPRRFRVFIHDASPCSEQRSELEETCGATGYVLDEETCEGQCAGCPDSDDDGVKDACDYCPSVSDYGRKKIKKYKVPPQTICGTYLYEGESCGYSNLQCDGTEEFHPISPSVIDEREMYRCCRATIEEEECVVDNNCNAVTGDGVCECPDGSTDCDGCPDGGCICPDTDGDGQPNNPCDTCQVDGCVCSDTDGDGQPNSPCLECQEDDSESTDTDGDGLPDNQDPCPNNPNPNCQPGDDTDGDGIPNNEDPCPNNPNPNCEPGDDDGDDIPDGSDPCPGNPDPDCTTTCLTTLDKFKAWTTTAESFPFNWMVAVKNMFGPLTSLHPSLPDSIGSMTVRLTVTEYGQSADLDFGSGYTVLRNSPVVTALAPAVALLRWAMGITIIFYMLPYFVARWHNIHGVSR